jgi:tetratricopeptide (TPR) repeat protein
MAAKWYRQVLRRNPDHPDTLFHLASLHMEESSFGEAYPLLLKLAVQDPGNSLVWVNLAVSEIALGRPEKAVSCLDTAMALENPPLFSIFLHHGVAQSRLGKLEEAVNWYEKSEELDPEDASLVFNMAITYDRLGRYREALAYYEKFLASSGDPPHRERREIEHRIRVLAAHMAVETKRIQSGRIP